MTAHTVEDPTTRPLRVAAVVAGAALASAVAAYVLGDFGELAVIAIAAAVGLGLLIWSVRDVLVPPLVEAMDRVSPARFAPTGSRESVPRSSARRRIVALVGVAAAAVASGVIAWQGAQLGLEGMALIGGLLVLALGLLVGFPLIVQLVATDPVDVPPRMARFASPEPVERTEPSRLTRLVVFGGVTVAASILAWQAAQMGLKGVLAIVGGLGLAACLLLVRDRTLFFMFASVCSLVFVMHKSFSAQDLELSGGAPAVYVTTFDAMIVLLYAIWIWEGSFLADVRVALHRPVLAVPLVGALFLLPSLLVADSVLHGVSELVRMGWMYLLFVYIAVRVRTPRHVWAVLAGLAVVASIEFIVVILQWRTGGVLGLSFLGVPTQLTERMTDVKALGRPFGTIIHPVFMGAVMGSLGMVALGVGLSLPRSLAKVAALVLVPVCTLPLYVAHTRASLVAYVMVAGVVGLVSLARKQLQWSTVGKVVVVGLIALALFWPQVTTKFVQNFKTEHFTEEVESRMELNDVAFAMIDDDPVLGVGLNNFEFVMDPYQKYGLIFFDNPVHHLYLLYLAETGIVGFIGVVLVGLVLFNVATRLSRSHDPLLGGVGLGVSGAFAFLMVEELLGFSLRQDIPLALFWLLAGLAVACYRMAGFEGDRRASLRRRLRGPRGPVPPDSAGRRRPSPTYIPVPDELDVPAHRVLVPALPHHGAAPETSNEAARDPVNDLPSRVALLGDAAASPLLPWDRRRRPHPVSRASVDDASVPELLSGGPGSPDEDRGHEPDPNGDRDDRGADDGSPPASAAAGTGGRKRRFGLTFLVVVILAALTVPFVAASPGFHTSDLMITFSASDREDGVQGIYVMHGDGTGVERITPNDGQLYSWPQWAMGGTKIVFTARTPGGIPENVYWMNPDGSGVEQLTDVNFRLGQPKVSPDGRSVIFSGLHPLYQIVAIYELDLETLEATNLSAVENKRGAAHADPKWMPATNRIVFANTDGGTTDIGVMNRDGTGRQIIADTDHYDTDPEYSPDEQTLAFASYRGGDGNPGRADQDLNLDITIRDWFLVVRDADTGTEKVLTRGKDCTDRRPFVDSCKPGESSAFKPVWTPDGKQIGFNGHLDRWTTCICIIGADGSNPHAIFASQRLALTWFDWIVPSEPPPTAVTDIGQRARSSRLLVTAVAQNGEQHLADASTDLMQYEEVPVRDDLAPAEGRWSADRSEVAFTARVPFDPDAPSAQPWPAPPPLLERRDHVTLADLDPAFNPPIPVAGDVAQNQVFVRDTAGRTQQITDPWIEDWRDGVRLGDQRGNTSPVFVPGTDKLLFTNISSLTGESFVLSVERGSNEVLNLTNGTAGAQRVDDRRPYPSPDGKQVAFTWTHGRSTEIFVMADDGLGVVSLTDDDYFDTAPAWSPDGRTIVYSSYRGGGVGDGWSDPAQSTLGLPRSDWYLIKVDVATGTQTVLTALEDSPAWNPVWAPEGDRIAFIGLSETSTDVFTVPAGGGPVRPALITPLQNELFVDWR